MVILTANMNLWDVAVFCKYFFIGFYTISVAVVWRYEPFNSFRSWSGSQKITLTLMSVEECWGLERLLSVGVVSGEVDPGGGEEDAARGEVSNT